MKHHLVAAAAVVVSLGAAASSAWAEGAGTFDAWGHTFDRTPAQARYALRILPNALESLTTGSIGDGGQPVRRVFAPGGASHYGPRGESSAD